MNIFWTDHAIQRAGERFGFRADIKIPNRVIQKVGAQVDDGQEFKVHRGSVLYVCKREGDRILVITVLTYREDHALCTRHISNSLDLD